MGAAFEDRKGRGGIAVGADQSDFFGRKQSRRPGVEGVGLGEPTHAVTADQLSNRNGIDGRGTRC